LVEAQERTTAAIIEQTKAIREQTEAQKADANSLRTLLSGVWDRFLGLFQKESDETQTAIVSHDTNMKTKLDNINQSVQAVDSSVDKTTQAVNNNTSNIVQAIRNQWGN
jgi:SMC interacting uncharacterized protein involved in chromosome segregation